MAFQLLPSNAYTADTLFDVTAVAARNARRDFVAFASIAAVGTKLTYLPPEIDVK